MLHLLNHTLLSECLRHKHNIQNATTRRHTLYRAVISIIKYFNFLYISRSYFPKYSPILAPSLVHKGKNPHCEVIMGAMASQSTSLTIVYSTVYSKERKHQSSVLLAICAGNSPMTGEFPAQMASNAENVSIWWRHHAKESAVSSRCDPCYSLAVGVICLIVCHVVPHENIRRQYSHIIGK